jgi:hypothetical protein
VTPKGVRGLRAARWRPELLRFRRGFRPPRGAQLLMFAPKTADSAVFGAIWSLRSRPRAGTEARRTLRVYVARFPPELLRFRPALVRSWERIARMRALGSQPPPPPAPGWRGVPDKRYLGSPFCNTLSAGSIRHTGTCACSSKIRGTAAAGAAPGRRDSVATGRLEPCPSGSRRSAADDGAARAEAGGGVGRGAFARGARS